MDVFCPKYNPDFFCRIYNYRVNHEAEASLGDVLR